MLFQKISTPSTEGFLVWTPHPSENSILVSYFPSKNRAFEIALRRGISVNLPWGGHGYFLELHIVIFMIRREISSVWEDHDSFHYQDTFTLYALILIPDGANSRLLLVWCNDPFHSDCFLICSMWDHLFMPEDPEILPASGPVKFYIKRK